MKPRPGAILLTGLLLIFLPVSFLTAQLRTVTIGSVVDGEWALNERTRTLFQEEITELLSGEFEVRFPDDKYLVADWTLTDIAGKITQLLNDPEVDVVLTPGVIASNSVSRRGPLPKPVIAPFVVDAELQNLPIKDGASGVENLSYISFPSTLQRDFEAFLEITSFKKLTLFFNAEIYRDLPGVDMRLKKATEEMDIEPNIIPVSSIEDALNGITDETDAVYVGPLLHIYGEEFDRLVELLIEKRIPSFSLFGREDVERGILASVNAQFMPKVARRVALNLQRILLGEPPSEIPFAFAPGEELTLNVETARKIGVFPPWGVYTEAVLLNEDVKEVDIVYNLQTAVLEGIDANLDMRAKQSQVAAGEHIVKEARSPLLPQIGLDLTGLQINKERAGIAQAERNLTGKATVTQVLYADDAWANYSIQKQFQRTREEELEALRLDIAQEIAEGYLNVLVGKTLEDIQRQNLKLSRSNLELSRVREAVGFSGRAEVFRWESQIAGNRQSVIDANAQRNVAEIQFNRLLNRPLEQNFGTREVSIDEVGMLTEENRLLRYMNNRIAFRALREFFVLEGIGNSPEIRQLDAAITAQDRLLKNTSRAFYLPDIVAQGEYSRIFSEGGVGANLGDQIDPDAPDAGFISGLRNKNNWSAALNLTYPLFNGGERFAQRGNAVETLAQLRTERKSLVQILEQRIRSASHIVGSSFAAIKQSKDAGEASRKNLDLVVDSYSLGTVDITQLLDAQNAALNASAAEANSIYLFLIDLMELERALGSSFLLQDLDNRKAFYQRLEDYFVSNNIIVR